MRTTFAAVFFSAMLLISCSAYTSPPEDFMAAQIQFSDSALTAKNVSVTDFIGFVRELKSGDRETLIKGWLKGNDTWTLVSESAGEQYEYQFTDVLSDKSGNARVVFQAIRRGGKIQDSATLLNLIIVR
jgi:uncharacterized membrane protein